ncbi:PREDICTED: ribosomal RNA processing protein 36 homolog [Polistes dominula]|uniref:rRNA biogenesis protein RRP36 n=1 Tax=Polistes dominula TaxID=743375 RepID=A0ABM1IG97_POLDO|nr:PREDICTED: ribosomal RNA processing protein 36 homolog [Polistes dominula]
MSDEENSFLDQDKDQAQIRAELANMSFEDLQKLKEKLGTKVYNETLFGPRKKKIVTYKRENKNRPREMSTKKQVPRFREIIQVKKNRPRDPRFDNLSGEFNEKAFKHAYSFINEIKEENLATLKNELKKTEDPKEIKKIKYLIQRLENQLREQKKLNMKKEKQIQERKEIINAIKSGQKPVFKKKSEKKVLDLISKYEELKSSGKLQTHIKKLRKKALHKSRPQMEQKRWNVTDME